MKANELMIGDWVKIKGLKDPIKRISCIDEYIGTVEFWDDERVIVTLINNVSPLPLTAKILEKNGFEWMEKDIEYILTLGGTFDVRAEVVNDSIWNINVYYTRANIEFYELQYVHELQHALRLAGIGEEIEI